MTKKVQNILLFAAFLLALAYLIDKTLKEKAGVERAEDKFIKESMELPADSMPAELPDSLAAMPRRDSLASPRKPK